MKKSNAIGSSFDSFLEEENILAEALATKRVLAYQMQQAIKKNKIAKKIKDMSNFIKENRDKIISGDKEIIENMFKLMEELEKVNE